MTTENDRGRAAVNARNALGQDMYLLSEIVLSVLAGRRWWARSRLVDTVRSWLKGSDPRDIDHVVCVYEQCGLIVRRRVGGRVDRLALPCRATGPRGPGLRDALDEAVQRHSQCVDAGRVMAREKRSLERMG